MKLNQLHECVWSLDEDIDLPDDKRTRPARGPSGQMVDSGYMLALDEVEGQLRQGAYVWSIRRMTVPEWEEVMGKMAENKPIARAYTVRARIHGTDTVLEGDALDQVLCTQGLALLGDLAARIVEYTLDRSFRCRAR